MAALNSSLRLLNEAVCVCVCVCVHVYVYVCVVTPVIAMTGHTIAKPFLYNPFTQTCNCSCISHNAVLWAPYSLMFEFLYSLFLCYC